MILDQSEEEIDGGIIDCFESINFFLKDLNILFESDKIIKSRITSNLKTTQNTINSLSSLLQRVHV